MAIQHDCEAIMLKYVCHDMISMVRHLPWGLAAGIPFALLLLFFKKRRKGEEIPVAGTFIFGIYFAVMMMITFLSRESGSRIGIDLELFSTLKINQRNNAYAVENIILFIPYGFFGCWAFEKLRNFLRCAAFGALTSLAIESLQLFTGRGYFQIDDILTNLLGTIIGFLIFRILWQFRKKD